MEKTQLKITEAAMMDRYKTLIFVKTENGQEITTHCSPSNVVERQRLEERGFTLRSY